MGEVEFAENAGDEGHVFLFILSLLKIDILQYYLTFKLDYMHY